MTAKQTRLAIGAVAAGGFWVLTPAPLVLSLGLTALLLLAVARTKEPACSCCGYTQEPYKQ